MCGIAGFQGRFDAGLLAAMTQAVAHRGPDGAGTLLLEGGPCPVGLGHRRLSIIDLSEAGAQPMAAPCRRCGSGGPADLVLTYNGEIYNFAELRAELVGRGHAFHSATDSEVLLHLYAEEGPRMLGRLNGIFAFAIYDGRENGRPEGVERGDLFLARDQLGVKPLYLAETRSGLLFASEMKALLHARELPREVDAHAVFQTLAYLWTPAPRTALVGVRKLPPGMALLARGGRTVREWRWYEVPTGQPLDPRPEAELAADLHRELQAAVSRQMVSDVPVGAFLSGGLDSSAVVALMRRAHPEAAPRCYTIGFRGGQSIEGSPPDLPYARRVAAHLGVELSEIEMGAESIGQLERMLYHLDEPQADPAPINALLICEQARADGIKVLLSGAGGDDVFSGYRRHRALGMERTWAWLPAAARAAISAPARSLRAGRNAGWMRSVPVRRVAKALAHAHLDADQRMAAYFWWNGEELRRSLLAPDVAARVAGESGAEPLLESLARIPGERDPLNRMLFLEAKHFLADHNLNYTDRMGMAVGVEVRVPLIDPEVLAFAARIPPRLKQRGAVGKAIFKRAMEPELPREVIYRAKTGFGAPLQQWLQGELREMVDETLSPASLRRRGLFAPGPVQRLLELDRAGRVEGAYTVFALMCVELWCRTFVDAPVPVAPARPVVRVAA
ncbi:MAG TPA: asparagine synthase (glutamine-hydrolyzing) [Longimicrobium sp.]|jgi:asparagine synthase (glutamine-hydrolysing)|nr:asparagine synthase (glutamine-hydrolyzing) [Longimicrobium sp.]